MQDLADQSRLGHFFKPASQSLQLRFLFFSHLTVMGKSCLAECYQMKIRQGNHLRAGGSSPKSAVISIL